MQKKTQTAFLNAIALLFAFAPYAVTNAQDAAELPGAESILDRYIEVTGGSDAYNDRRSQVISGTISIAAAGISGAIVIYQEGSNFYTAIELPGVGTVESGVTDGIAWEYSLLQGARIKEGVEKAQALREADINALVNWRGWFPQAETVGMEPVNGEDSYEVVMTPEDGGPQTMFFSVDSGLALRTEIVAASPLGDIPLQVTMADYEEYGGILAPTTITQSLAGQSIHITFESAEFNVDIPAEQFDLPSDVAAILQ